MTQLVGQLKIPGGVQDWQWGRRNSLAKIDSDDSSHGQHERRPNALIQPGRCRHKKGRHELGGLKRFERRLLFRCGGGHACLGLFGEPFVEFLLFNHAKGSLHGGVEVAAQLGADDHEFAGLGGAEMNWDAHAGDGILSDAHAGHFEAVDDIHGGNTTDYLLIDWYEVWLTQKGKIVFGSRIGCVNAEWIGGVGKFDVLLTPKIIRSFVVRVPLELLRHDLDVQGFLGIGKFVDRLGPQWDGKAQKQEAFDTCHSHFGIGGKMGASTDIIRFGIGGFPESENGVNEIGKPSNEERGHQQMDVKQEGIQSFAMSGGYFRKLQQGLKGIHGRKYWGSGGTVRGHGGRADDFRRGKTAFTPDHKNEKRGDQSEHG